MTEPLGKKAKGYKIWKNPNGPGEPPIYQGEFYPPAGQFFFFGKDLRQLGMGRGRYTVLAPQSAPYSDFFHRWQTVVVTE